MPKIAYPKVSSSDGLDILTSQMSENMSGDSQSTPQRLVISNPNLADYLIVLSAKNVLARLPDPITSPEPTYRDRSLASTNATTTVHNGKSVYLIRCWGKDGQRLTGRDEQGDWEITRTEGRSRIFLGKSKENNPFSLQEIIGIPVLEARPDSRIIDVEDARVTFLSDLGLYGITVTETRMTRNSKGDEGITFSPAIYLTNDFYNYTRMMGNPETGLWSLTKDWVLFPKRVYDPNNQERFAALFSTRVGKDDRRQAREKYYRNRPGIWIAYSDNLVNWYGHHEILIPTDSEAKLGPSSQPIDIGRYWLIFIHAVRIEQHTGNGVRYVTQDQVDSMSETEKQAVERVYTPQAALLDKLNPNKVGYITKDLIQPSDWEISPKYRLRHHMIASAMEAVLLDGSPTRAYVTWHGGGDMYSGASIIKPENLRDVMQKVPAERIPIPIP